MNLTCKKNLNLVNFYVMNIGLGFTISYLWYNKKRDIAFAIVALFLTLGHLRDTLCAIFQTISMLFKSGLAKLPYSSTLTKTIINVVPCYNETIDNVMATINTLGEQNNIDQCKTITNIIVDGNESLYNQLIGNFNLLFGTRIEYTNWKNINFGINVSLCDYNGKLIIVMGKVINSGKKCSLILADELLIDIFHTTNSAMMNKWAYQTLCNQIKEQFTVYDISTVDYIYHIDSDTRIDELNFYHMINKLEQTDADACCGFVKVDFSNSNRYCNLWNNLQYSQYFGDQILKRGTEGILECVTCLPGCNNMVKFNPEKHLVVLDHYKRLPTEDKLIQTVSRMVGTDRCYTKAVLKNGGKIVMEKNAIVYTRTPQSLLTLISQRKRWCSNTITNSYCIMVSAKTTYFNKLNAFIDMLRIYFTPFRLVSMIGFLYSISDITMTQFYIISGFILPAILFTGLHVIFWERGYRLNLLIGYTLNKMFTPIISTVIAITLMTSLDDTRWNPLDVDNTEELGGSLRNSFDQFETEVVVNTETEPEVVVNTETEPEVVVNTETEPEVVPDDLVTTMVKDLTDDVSVSEEDAENYLLHHHGTLLEQAARRQNSTASELAVSLWKRARSEPIATQEIDIEMGGQK